MRDGTKLYTAVYLPKKIPGTHPILIERTPYGAGPFGPNEYKDGIRGSKKFTDNGYIFVFQDVRGRDHSEGKFVSDRPQLINPLKPDDIDESTDAYDSIDYLVKNVPDNNGRVGLWGISYPGFYAGAGAINSHPALKAASPQAPVSDWFIGDDFHHNGALFLMDAMGFARFGESPRTGKSEDDDNVDTAGDPVSYFLKHGTIDEFTQHHFKDTDGVWKDLIDHPTYDEYWQARSLPLHMKNIHCAVMTVGGFFDAEDCWGALHTYQGVEKQNKGITNTIVEGPWFHGGWERSKADRFGDIEFGQSTAEYYQNQIEFPFFDNYLRGDGSKKQPEAQVFQTGSNRWLKFANWPPKQVKATTFYLQKSKMISENLSESSSVSTSDEYISDPANPVPYQGGKITDRTREYMIDDQRFASKRADVLSYETEPLKKPLSLAGPVTANLYVETTGTDADFIVKVIDVYPDSAPPNTAGVKMAGYQMLVRAEIMRAKFRKSYMNPSPLLPNKVENVSYELPDICHTILPGHRLMVQIQSSWFPLVDRNPQKFCNIFTAKPEDFQKSTIHIYHSPQYPTSITVGRLPN